MPILEAVADNSYAYFALGVCAEKSQDSEQALANYRKASRLAPDDRTVFVRFMNLLLSRDDLRAQAMDEIEGRLSGPLAYLALWYRARFEIKDKNWKSAPQTLSDAFKAAQEQNAYQDLPGIQVDHGDVLRQIGDYESAKTAYARAYEIDPLRQDVVVGKALCHCEVAEFEEDRICLEKALESATGDPAHADLWNLHGWSLQHLGDAAHAVESYRKAFEFSEQKDPWYRKGLANVLMNFRPEEARSHFNAIWQQEKSIGSQPTSSQPSGDASTVGLLGWCNYRLGFYDEAIRLIKTVVDRSADEQSAVFDLGLVYLASGRNKLAEDTYLRGYELTQKCQVLRQRGLFYVALFDLADARHQRLLGQDSESIFKAVEEWLHSSGVAVERLPWLADGGIKV